MENDIITKRTEEVINFISYRETNDFRYDYVKAFLIELIPFRNTNDLYSEMALFNQKYGKNITQYSDLIIYICREVFPQYDSSWIKDFLNMYRINNFSFSKDGSWLLGKNVKYKEEEIPLYEEKLKEVYFTSLNDNIEILGYYAEYLVKEYLANHQDKYSFFKWVSQDIGDGLGYDFIAYNNETKKWNYIEVKSKASSYDTVLSYNETKKLSSINSNYLDEEYIVFWVSLVLNKDHFEHDIVEYYTDSENKNPRCESLITKSNHIIFHSFDAQEEDKKEVNGKAYKKTINFF